MESIYGSIFPGNEIFSGVELSILCLLDPILCLLGPLGFRLAEDSSVTVGLMNPNDILYWKDRTQAN